MKTDPDFHPVASAWLDGRASQPEQSILREILPAEPGVMKEFAALCHTEVLLQQSATAAAFRRESLAKLMSGKPLTKRPADLWKNRITRGSAAAALLTVAVWSMMRLGNDSDAITVAEKQAPSKAPVRTAAGGGRTSNKAETKNQLPEAAPGFELLLKRFYMVDFKAAGSLPEAVALLVKDVHLADGKSPEVEILDAGDAPVSLALNVSLPAWTLLQIMALQSGTRMKISGESLVFQQAENPSDRVRSVTRSSNFNLLPALLPSPENHPDNEDISSYGNLAQHAFGSQLTFSGTRKNLAECTGPVRDIEVLKLALHEIDQSSVRVNLSMKLMNFQPEPGGQDLSEPSGRDAFTLAGVFTDTQMQLIMRAASVKKGVDLMTFTPVNTPPNLFAGFDESYSGNKTAPMPITAKVIVRPLVQDTCELRYEIKMVGNPGIDGTREITEFKNSVVIWNGQTVAFKGKHPNGSEIMLFLTANLTDAAGQLLAQSRNPGSSALSEDVPDGIPSPWANGFFISPFAPAQGEIDLTAVKSGAQVHCPFTGKLFRKP